MVTALPALREVRKDLAGLLERGTVEHICRELNHTRRSFRFITQVIICLNST
jgi:hypothetical protein